MLLHMHVYIHTHKYCLIIQGETVIATISRKPNRMFSYINNQVVKYMTQIPSFINRKIHIIFRCHRSDYTLDHKEKFNKFPK